MLLCFVSLYIWKQQIQSYTREMRNKPATSLLTPTTVFFFFFFLWHVYVYVCVSVSVCVVHMLSPEGDTMSQEREMRTKESEEKKYMSIVHWGDYTVQYKDDVLLQTILCLCLQGQMHEKTV